MEGVHLGVRIDSQVAQKIELRGPVRGRMKVEIINHPKKLYLIGLNLLRNQTTNQSIRIKKSKSTKNNNFFLKGIFFPQ